MSDEVPEPWASAMIENGCVDRRRIKDPVASYRALAERASAHKDTVRRLILGIGRPDDGTVGAVANVLGQQVYDWLKIAHPRAPWAPKPTDARLLTDEEGAALDTLIRVMTHGRREEVAEPRDNVVELPAAARKRKPGSSRPGKDARDAQDDATDPDGA